MPDLQAAAGFYEAALGPGLPRVLDNGFCLVAFDDGGYREQ